MGDPPPRCRAHWCSRSHWRSPSSAGALLGRGALAHSFGNSLSDLTLIRSFVSPSHGGGCLLAGGFPLLRAALSLSSVCKGCARRRRVMCSSENYKLLAYLSWRRRDGWNWVRPASVFGMGHHCQTGSAARHLGGTLNKL